MVQSRCSSNSVVLCAPTTSLHPAPTTHLVPGLRVNTGCQQTFGFLEVAKLACYNEVLVAFGARFGLKQIKQGCTCMFIFFFAIMLFESFRVCRYRILSGP